jgi:RNA polymerase-binding protein DksA
MSSQLTAGQIASLKAALRSRFEALQEEVRQDVLNSDDDRAALLADRVRDLEDESVADVIVDTDLADTDRDLQELQDVEGALTRMSQGGYGTCIKCGDAIPFERLQAYPTAKRCQPCQEMREKTFARKATPTL